MSIFKHIRQRQNTEQTDAKLPKNLMPNNRKLKQLINFVEIKI